MHKQPIQKMPSIKFTKSGYEKVKADLEILKQKRPSAVTSLRIAREMGDLSENGAYKAARFELSSIDREIRRMTFLIRFGEITEVTTTDEIGFGSTITLDDGKAQMTFMLVDGYESDPKQQKLSLQSPIGRAVFGKRKGEKVIIHAPAGYLTYTILSVS